MQSKYVKIFESGKPFDELELDFNTDEIELENFTWTPFNGADYELSDKSIGIDGVEGDLPGNWIAFEHTELTQMFEELEGDTIPVDEIREAIVAALNRTLTIKSEPAGLVPVQPEQIADLVINYLQGPKPE